MSRRYLLLISMLAATAFATTGSAQTAIGPSGFQVLGPASALVWENGGDQIHSGTFRMWRVDLTPSATWRPVAIPPALKSFAENTENQVLVTFNDNTLRLFWITTQECVKGREDPECFLNDVYQAQSSDYGKAWQVFVSRFQVDGPPMSAVMDAPFADSTHGWMLLHGDAGLGGLEEMLATTSDGGGHWTKAKASGMPIGRNAAQLLIARSATEAWFASLHFDKDRPLVMAHTTDTGQTWQTSTSFAQSYAWCANCIADDLSSGGNRYDPEHACFGAMLAADASGSWSSLRGHARYCLTANGQNWSVPERTAEPGASSQDALPRYNGFPLFAAGSRLGFAETCTEASASRDCHIYQTSDGGNDWQLAGDLPPLGSMNLTEVQASGDHIWLLMSVAADARQGKLYYSADRGRHWMLVSRGPATTSEME